MLSNQLAITTYTITKSIVTIDCFSFV